MMSEEPIVNRVSKSPLVSIDLETYLEDGEVMGIDLKDQLFQGMILREKDFRNFIKEHDWTLYEHSYVYVHCSADAIVPIWAYMLVTSKLGNAKMVVQGDENELEKERIRRAIRRMLEQEESLLQDGKVVIKGCGNVRNKEYAYTEMTRALLPKVTSLMYGEPCSTVPIYKRPKI